MFDAFELWCWRRLLRVPWTARWPSQSILKEISPEYSLEGLMLKLKLQYLATWCKELTHWKRPWCWERLKPGGKGITGDEMVRWHHWLDGYQFEQALRVGDGQGSLVCCSPWGCKEMNMTEWLNWSEVKWEFHYIVPINFRIFCLAILTCGGGITYAFVQNFFFNQS